MRIGLHCNKGKTFSTTAERAVEVGANTLQIFSASPRMWCAATPGKDEVRDFRKAREKHGLEPLVIHASYLINLASLDETIRENSIAAFRGELQRAALLTADFLVVHPGNYKDSSLEQGLAAFALGLAEAAKGLALPGVTVLLENTVGGGTRLGGRLEELHVIRELASRETDLAIGYCLDTCHLFGAGFDVSTEAGLESTLAHAEATLGLDRVGVIHTNDSKGKLGSHLDRHANIGHGEIGEEGFGRILRHAELKNKPFILETPDEEDGDQLRDIQTLHRLVSA